MFWLDPAVWFWIPLGGGVFALLLLPLARSREAAWAVAVLSLGTLGVSFVGTTFWGWLLRDGLGPDMVQSHGTTAIWHFAQLAGAPLLGLLAVCGLVVWVCAWRAKRLPPTTG